MKMRNRKGQIQTMETIGVLFIFFILIALSMVFFATIQKSSAQTKILESHKVQSVKVAQTVANLPELRASRRGIQGVNTFDTLKMQAFINVIERDFELRKGIYEEKLGTSKIGIIEIYPGNREWILYDNSLDKYTSIYNYYVPVSLFNPLDLPSGNHSVGLMQISYYRYN